MAKETQEKISTMLNENVFANQRTYIQKKNHSECSVTNQQNNSIKNMGKGDKQTLKKTYRWSVGTLCSLSLITRKKNTNQNN